MKNTEFAVGEVFQFGLRKLKAVELKNHSECDGCVLAAICEVIYPYYVEMIVGQCEDIHRTDKKNVIFVEVEEQE